MIPLKKITRNLSKTTTNGFPQSATIGRLKALQGNPKKVEPLPVVCQRSLGTDGMILDMPVPTQDDELKFEQQFDMLKKKLELLQMQRQIQELEKESQSRSHQVRRID